MLSRRLDPEALWPMPVARSYDGSDWELVAPTANAPEKPRIQCKGAAAKYGCSIRIPADGATYTIDRHVASVEKGSQTKVAARFLMQVP